MNDKTEKQKIDLQNLMGEAKNGNIQAFEIIYNEYYTPLFRYIKSRIRNNADAEDMTQTVFMKVWNRLPNWNEEHTSPTAFFFQSARNMIIDTFRKKSHRDIISDELVANRIDAENLEHNSHTNQDDTTEKLYSYIKRLSEEQQEILSLLYTNDFSYEEIARITGKREDAIRQTHSRAIKKLRTYYEQTK